VLFWVIMQHINPEKLSCQILLGGSLKSHIPYILESNPHPFYSFRGLKNQTRIRIARRLHSRSRAGFW